MSIFSGQDWAYSRYVQSWERAGGMSPALRFGLGLRSGSGLGRGRGGYGAVDAVWYVPWMTEPQYGPYMSVELPP